jgi:hypothetical protein
MSYMNNMREQSQIVNLMSFMFLLSKSVPQSC